MKRLVAVILVVFAASASADIRWTRDKVVGVRFYIVDPVRVESYWCTKDGFVAVEIGTHKVVTPPLWNWKIHEGRLQLSDSDSVREELTLLQMHNGLLTVRKRSGQIASFRYRFEHPKT